MTIFSNKLVFLADDDSDDRELFALALRETGIPASLAIFDSGASLIDAIVHNRQRPDILFLDLNMPGKSGFDCLVEIKTCDQGKSIPVIILSTSSNPRNIDYCYDHGAALYAVKPADFSTLCRLIERAVADDWRRQVSKKEFLLDLSGFSMRRS